MEAILNFILNQRRHQSFSITWKNILLLAIPILTWAWQGQPQLVSFIFMFPGTVKSNNESVNHRGGESPDILKLGWRKTSIQADIRPNSSYGGNVYFWTISNHLFNRLYYIITVKSKNFPEWYPFSHIAIGHKVCLF
jgi:hypothetical protein